ncbi:tuberin-like [Ostrinia furnacalis]|uniref:tuberin-like n=1 Tax=Ostrinia furnacalis TaxID=93504 RepID=UPI0010390B2D|nr:tuberin-like [Ostrinia furnacalis]
MSTYPITPPVPGEAPTISNPLNERPLRVSGAQHERTIKNLDLVPPVETYKVGVLYVGPGQHDNEVLILKNEYGSVRYAEFLSALGTLVSLAAGEEQPHLFLNLEKGGKDGHYTYVWHDDIMQVLFHVATAMPTLAKDPNCNEKRKYIGNDYVSIVYNDSGQEFNISTIKVTYSHSSHKSHNGITGVDFSTG